MAAKYYVVWKGRQPGIFKDWATCRQQVDKFPGARYKSFKTLQEAESAFNGGSQSGPGRARKAASGAGAGSSARRSSSRASSAGNAIKTLSSGDIAGLSLDTMIYTDGGCEPNPGQAGSGVAVYRAGKIAELWYGIYNPRGTNNTAELNALFEGMKLAQEELAAGSSVAIFSDSRYAIQCVTQWAFSWQKKGWKKAGGEIKNLELIQQMFSLYQQLRSDISVHHVNGHVGIEGNELADRMSILAVESKQADFVRYAEPVDVSRLLAMRAG